MFECIPISWRVNLLQTPTREISFTNNYDKTTYLPEQNAYVPLAQHYTKPYESTLVHGLTKYIKFEDGKFRESGYAHDDPLRPWEETNLYSALVSVDEEERYDLLTTKDEHGNTPIHKLWLGEVLPFLLDMQPVGTDKAKPLFARNNKGNTPLHNVGQFSKEGWIALVDLVTVEVMCNLLTIQNDQGDTIIHKYFRLKDYETPSPESAIKLLQVLTSKTPKHDKTFLLLTNRREENCLHSMLRSYQRFLLSQ